MPNSLLEAELLVRNGSEGWGPAPQRSPNQHAAARSCLRAEKHFRNPRTSTTEKNISKICL